MLEQCSFSFTRRNTSLHFSPSSVWAFCEIKSIARMMSIGPRRIWLALSGCRCRCFVGFNDPQSRTSAIAFALMRRLNFHRRLTHGRYERTLPKRQLRRIVSAYRYDNPMVVILFRGERKKKNDFKGATELHSRFEFFVNKQEREQHEE